MGQPALTGKAAWECLHKIFLMVADKCGWTDIVLSNKQINPQLSVIYVNCRSITNTQIILLMSFSVNLIKIFILIFSSSPAKVRWKGLEYISGFNSSSRGPFDPPRQVAIACFYISVFLFFETAWSYYSHIYQVTDCKSM